MIFTSFTFFIFFVIVSLLYFLLPKKLKHFVLLIASYVFYGWANVIAIPLFIITTVVSYFSAIQISKAETKGRKKAYMALATVVCFGILFVFKYAGFTVDSIQSLLDLFKVSYTPLIVKLLLPVGISFYTFQTVSYVIDVYRGTMEAEHDFFFYALFVSFFPQLVAGPIERPGDLLPQLKEPHQFDMERFGRGVIIALIGFFKKIAVADTVAPYVNAVFNNAPEADGIGVWCAAVLFAFQIYGDFSGYTDIARGCAMVLGIKLSDNFNEPYSATSIRDFWNRWHLTLSTWFRDYLYFPLGGSRVPPARYALNILIVFSLSGLWHGAAWTFVLWGVLHALYQIVGFFKNKLLYKTKNLPETNNIFLKAWRQIFTFILVTFAWIAFRANSTGDMLTLYGKALTPSLKTSFFKDIEAIPFIGTICSILLVLLIDRTLKKKPEAIRLVEWIGIALTLVCAWILLAESGGGGRFIYFRF